MKKLMLLALVGLTLSAGAQKNKPQDLAIQYADSTYEMYRDTTVVRILQFSDQGLLTWTYAYSVNTVHGRKGKMPVSKSVFLSPKGTEIRTEDIYQVLAVPQR